MKPQIRWKGGAMTTTIQGIEGCSVDCSYYAGTPLRHWDDTPDYPEFDILRAYDPDGNESKDLLHSIDEADAERIQDEWIEFDKGRWI
jgi:hypothetical protein